MKVATPAEIASLGASRNDPAIELDGDCLDESCERHDLTRMIGQEPVDPVEKVRFPLSGEGVS